MRQVKAGSIVPMVRNLGLLFTAILLVFFAVIAGQLPTEGEPYIPAFSSEYYYEKGEAVVLELSKRVGNETLKAILMAEIPVLTMTGEGKGASLETGERFLKTCLNVISGVRLDDPLTYLKAEIPIMKVTPVTAEDTYDEIGFDQISVTPNAQRVSGDGLIIDDNNYGTGAVVNRIKSDTPIIALYNTHTSETFELTDGLAHLKWKAGGVTEVAKEIKRVIEENYGIAVVYADKLHDKSFNKSYSESEKTVKQLLKDHEELEMLFDIHRDGSLTREQSLVEIEGRQVGRVLIVVGTDARAEHPRWKENLEFARRIAAKMDVMYPGLSRGIATKQGRYNQQYSPRGLLIEIGTAKNSTEEAVASGRLFANVIVAVLNDMEQEGELTR